MKSYKIDEIVDIRKLIGTDDDEFSCDFHDDENSATVEDNHYKCKCCGADYTASQYLSQKNGISRSESLAFLYRLQNETIPSWLVENVKPSLNAYRIHKKVCEMFSDQLQTESESSIKCLNYIKNERKISTETIQKFGLGYFPKDKDFLKGLIEEFGEAELKELGLITDGKYGTFSQFSDRLIFPIRNSLNQICGIGARTLNKDVKPKYVNSQSSNIFSKSDLLYSDTLGKKSIGIVTEGYMDVISCSQSDDSFSYYASLGTALNSTQVRRILDEHEIVVICTDGDSAGQTSIQKFIKEQLRNLPHEKVKFVKIPNNQDPDEFIRSEGADEFQKLILSSKNAKEYIEESHPGPDTLTLSEKLDQFNITP